jgi:gamma-glutamyltranspeptidase/glutathione hydrolase
MVVSSQRLASQVGADILKAGGNAIDAAVAVAYAEAVVNPCCGNIGGGGFLVLHRADGQSRFINFREKAPGAASRDMYLDAAGNVVKGASLRGWKAAGVPGTVLGLNTALAEYGTLPLARVMAPAVALARDGFVLTRGDTDILDFGAKLFAGQANVARVFLRPDGSSWRPGDRVVQAGLARTLQAIAAGGSDAFYTGEIPRQVEAASRAGGGLLTAADFAAYTVTESEPLSCRYRGATILSAPPPSSGGTTLCEILTILDGYDLRAAGFNSARTVHLMVEAMRRAFADRNILLGDPDFGPNPVAQLLSPAYAEKLRATIRPDRATPSADIRPAPENLPQEKPETTHISVMDRAGNAVSLTYTINGYFGAGVMAGETGFFLNDEMDDFTVKLGVPNLASARSRRWRRPSCCATARSPWWRARRGVRGSSRSTRRRSSTCWISGWSRRRRWTPRASITSGCPTRSMPSRSRSRRTRKASCGAWATRSSSRNPGARRS